MDNNSQGVSCTGSGGQASGRNQVRDNNQVHEVFGDVHAGGVILVLLLLHLMQHMMRDPCSC